MLRMDKKLPPIQTYHTKWGERCTNLLAYYFGISDVCTHSDHFCDPAGRCCTSMKSSLVHYIASLTHMLGPKDQLIDYMLLLLIRARNRLPRQLVHCGHTLFFVAFMVVLKFQWDLDLFERCKVETWVQRSHHMAGASALRKLEREFVKAMEFNFLVDPDTFKLFRDLVKKTESMEHSSSVLNAAAGEIDAKNAFASLELECEHQALELAFNLTMPGLYFGGGWPSHSTFYPSQAFSSSHAVASFPPVYHYAGVGTYVYR